MTDPTLIRQALVNLLDNASKYSPPEAPIGVEVVPNDAEVEIAVKDEGPGIAPADLPHIFDSFYRGSRDRRVTPGAGLGLAIVKAFVETAGGAVSIESSEAGSRFSITLPLVAEPARIA
jgi:signal transduction histidine kinase